MQWRQPKQALCVCVFDLSEHTVQLVLLPTPMKDNIN